MWKIRMEIDERGDGLVRSTAALAIFDDCFVRPAKNRDNGKQSTSLKNVLFLFVVSSSLIPPM